MPNAAVSAGNVFDCVGGGHLRTAENGVKINPMVVYPVAE